MEAVKEGKKTELFERMPIAKAVMSMSLPTVISALVMVLYNLADTYFVGMLNDPIENAAVTLAMPMMLAFHGVTNLFGVGSSTMMSRCLGKKDYAMVRQSSVFGFYGALVSGLLYSLCYAVFRQPLLAVLGASPETVGVTGAYLGWTVGLGAVPAILNVILAYLVRAEGASLHASLGTMSGCLLNMLLDPVFILPWGLDMGAAGAGLATFLSNCAACGYFFVLLYLKRGRTFVCINPVSFRVNRSILKEVCGVGIPASVQNLLNVTGMTVLNNFTSPYGADAVAAMGISYKIYMIPMNIAMGISQGIMPLVSYSYAAGNIQRMKQTIFFAMKIAAGFLAAASVGYYIGAEGLISLFMKKEAVIAYGSSFLRGMCLGQVFLGIDFLAVGVFQSCGMGRKGLLFAVLRKVVLEIPALFILNSIWPLYGLAYAQAVTEVVLALAAVLSLHKICKAAMGKM